MTGEQMNQIKAALDEIANGRHLLVNGGVCIVVEAGYISGNPYLISTDRNNAFAFADEIQAQAFLYHFGAAFTFPRIVPRRI